MSEFEFWARFVLASLATWRITHLLAREDGPADVLARLRAWLGESFAGKLMDCFHCLSLWVAAPTVFFVARRTLDLLVAWLAISGAACVLERLVGERVVFESAPNEGAANDGMLRSETGAHQDDIDPARDAKDASSQAAGAANGTER